MSTEQKLSERVAELEAKLAEYEAKEKEPEYLKAKVTDGQDVFERAKSYDCYSSVWCVKGHKHDYLFFKNEFVEAELQVNNDTETTRILFKKK